MTIFKSIRLSIDESATLYDGVATLAQANLPLAEGLRVWAAEFPNRKVRAAAQRIAVQLEHGRSLPDALALVDRGLPASLRAAKAGGIEFANFAGLIREYSAVKRNMLELRRKMITSVLYPLILLVVFLGVLLLFQVGIASTFKQLFHEFGLRLPAVTQVFLYSPPYIIVGIALITVGLLAAPLSMTPSIFTSHFARISYLTPFAGRASRAVRYAGFSRFFGELINNRVPVPAAFRAVAPVLYDRRMEKACLKIAAEAETGMPFTESRTFRRLFPPCLVNYCDWGAKNASLDKALRASSDLYETQTISNCGFFEAFVTPILSMMIAIYVPFLAVAMIMPLVSLITSLTGGK